MNVKLLSDKATLPFRARSTDAGYDLYSVEDLWLDPQQVYKVHTDVAVKIPDGYVGLIRDRSGLGSKGISVLAGVIDSSYTGECLVCLTNHSSDPYYVKAGDRIAQLVVIANYNGDLNLVDNLDETDRATQGFGSSGK